MKIAVNTRFLLKNKLEGIGRVTYELLRRMVVNHPEDEFIFFFDREYDEQFILGKNVTPVVLQPPTRHPILIYTWFEFSVKKALKKYQPDVFFSTDGFCCLSTDVKTVVMVHDLAYAHFPEQVSFFVKKFYQRYQPQYLKKANHVLTVSNFVKKDIVKKIKIPASKIDVVHNGCNDSFQPLDEISQNKIQKEYANGVPYFFYVGAVHPRKNVHRLIEAFDNFKNKTDAPHQLLIAGRFAWQTGEVKSAYDNAKYQKEIQFLGFVSDEELPKLMASAFVLVYPSMFEGFGLPLLEAMNCDVPVITSNVSSMPEVIGNAGLLVNPNEVNEIEKAMLEIFQKEELRKKMIEKGKEQREKFNWDDSAEKVYQVLAEYRISNKEY